MRKNKTERRAAGSIILIFLLSIMLVITTYAWMASSVAVNGHLFQNAHVEIDLNGGQRVFDGSDDNIEPGMAVKRDFTLTNKSNTAVWYRLNITRVGGALRDALDVSVYNGKKLLCSEKLAEVDKNGGVLLTDSMDPGEKLMLTAVFKMREETGNQYQRAQLTFDLTADAVQKRNNPDRIFQ